MRRPSDYGLEARAHHEAGHAVLGWHFGRRLLRVWVDPTSDGGGATFETADADWENEAIVWLAGKTAHLKVDPDAADTAGKPPPWAYDLVRFRRLVADHEPDEDGQIDVESRLELRARGLVDDPEIWRRICALAAALSRSLCFTGPEAVAIIEAAEPTAGS